MEKSKRYDNIAAEISGSLGDLGTMLPYLIGAVTVAKLNVAGVLIMIGFMYLFTAWFYRLPIPVQPMKVIGAAIIVNQLTAGEIAAAGLLMGAVLLLVASTGLIDYISSITPLAVTKGIQAGLGISLALLGLKMIKGDWLLGVIVMVAILLLLNSRRLPAALVALIGGTLLAFHLHPELNWPGVTWGLSLPGYVIPAAPDFYRGFFQGFLPQLPLTLTNSVLVTTALAHQLFPDSSERVSDRHLCLTLGIGNLIGAPLGMLPVCHGSGGLAAHYRFGARTGYSIVIIGLLFLFLGLFLGSSGLQIMQVIPQAVLGAMLFYSGLDLIRAVKLKEKNEYFVFSVVIILSVGLNPGIAFLVGVPLWLVLYKGWIKV